MILKDLTLEKENKLEPYKSKDYIWASCRYCGEPHRILYEKYIRKGSACHKECSNKEKKISSPFKNPEVLKKCKETMIKRYGVENPSQSDIINKKRSKTNLTRYGVENPFQNQEIKDIIKLKSLEKYGCDNPAKNQEIKKQLSIKRKLSCNDNDLYPVYNLLKNELFWEELKNGNTLWELAEKNSVNYGSLISLLNEPEYKEKYNSLYSYPKQQRQKELSENIASFYNGKIECNNRKVINPLELDIYLPEEKIGVEFNGMYWHSEAILTPEIAKYKHYNKTKLCKDLGIRLFHVFESRWLERKDPHISIIRSALKMNKNRINARDCFLRDDNKTDIINFLDKNHIQGSAGFDFFYSLNIEGSVVGCITFSKHHRVNSSPFIVLNRLCFKSDCNIVGGSERLFSKGKDLAKKLCYSGILSWSDNTYSYGDVYKRLGFTNEYEYGPDYFYWNKNDNTIKSKQSCKKQSGVEITER